MSTTSIEVHEEWRMWNTHTKAEYKSTLSCRRCGGRHIKLAECRLTAANCNFNKEIGY